jgi:hypothetical protein
LPATQEEKIEKVRQLATQMGVTPDDIAAADQKIRSGDRNAIQTWNMLLKQVRYGTGSPFPANPTNFAPPVQSFDRY